MTPTTISFVLTNSTTTDALAVLLPATALKADTLAGKFLAPGAFLDASGTITLNAGQETPVRTIGDLIEYAQSYPDLQITAASIAAPSQVQARQPFICRQHRPFGPPTDEIIADAQSFGTAIDAVNHVFAAPFSSPAKNCSLLVKVRAGQTITLSLTVRIPTLDATASDMGLRQRAAAPVINGQYAY